MVLADWSGSSSVSTTMPSSPCSQRMVLRSVTDAPSDSLDQGRDAHAAADAQGHHGPARLAPLQLVDHRADEHGAGRAERVAHGDRAAVDVQLVVRDVQLALVVQNY